MFQLDSFFRSASKPIMPAVTCQDLVPLGHFDSSLQQCTTPTKRKTTIYDLPTELMLEIHSELDEQSKACLALSCTKFYLMFPNELHRFAMYPHPIPQLSGGEVARTEFLLKLQTPTLLFCDACLLLHPRHEFCDEIFDLGVPRSCKWPGIIRLCQHYTFISPKALIPFANHLQTLRREKNIEPSELLIQNWHACKIYSEIGMIDLSISVRLNQENKVVFHMVYAFDVDLSKLDQDRTIWLCEHSYGREPYASTKFQPTLCIECMCRYSWAECLRCTTLNAMQFLSCRQCGIRPDIEVTEWKGSTRCTAEFDKIYSVPSPSPSNMWSDIWCEANVDFNWTNRDPNVWRRCGRRDDRLEGRPVYHGANDVELCGSDCGENSFMELV